MIKYSFPPLTHPEATVLILGTMPGAQSLALSQYYGHPQNAFWKIMFALFDTPYSKDYEERKNLVLKNRIAVWDVLEACIREGSLDSAIQEEVPNDIHSFLKAHPNITHIFFNGQKAAAFFKKHIRLDKEYHLTTLPSTSPAHAGKSFEKKLSEWSAIKHISN